MIKIKLTLYLFLIYNFRNYEHYQKTLASCNIFFYSKKLFWSYIRKESVCLCIHVCACACACVHIHYPTLRVAHIKQRKYLLCIYSFRVHTVTTTEKRVSRTITTSEDEYMSGRESHTETLVTEVRPKKKMLKTADKYSSSVTADLPPKFQPVDLTIEVPVPPKFIQALKSITTMEGTRVTFEGMVTGNLTLVLKLEWLFLCIYYYIYIAHLIIMLQYKSVRFTEMCY